MYYYLEYDTLPVCFPHDYLPKHRSRNNISRYVCFHIRRESIASRKRIVHVRMNVSFEPPIVPPFELYVFQS